MRPVNLIPPEERRGERGSTRTGPMPYVLVGALVAVLAGITAMAITDSQISDRKAEVAKLEREDAAARARAERLAPYTQFKALSEKRAQTVSELADSRFDWERVMRELALVLPHDVWLTSLDASAEGGGAAGGAISGPSLTLSGCATGHDAVAGFVTALREIDGVTRVGVESSDLASAGAGSGGGSGGGSGSGCQTREFIASFNMTVAFDAAPVSQLESSEEAPATATEQAQTTSTETSSEGGG